MTSPRRSIQQSQRCIATLPAPARWAPEPSTDFLVARYGGQSGVYLLGQHGAYSATVDDVYKIGRADTLSERFAAYREAQTIVAFRPTPVPRAVEAVVKVLLRPFVVHGQETVQAPRFVIDTVFDDAIRYVEDGACALGHTLPSERHRAYDQRLRAWALEALNGETGDCPAPDDVPLDHRDVLARAERLEAERRREEVERRRAEAKAETKRQLAEAKSAGEEAKRAREEDEAAAKRRRLEAKRARVEDEAAAKRRRLEAKRAREERATYDPIKTARRFVYDEYFAKDQPFKVGDLTLFLEMRRQSLKP